MIKERIIILIIRLIEFIVNNETLVPFLNYFSKRAHQWILSGFKVDKLRSSLFRGMRVAFIADGNRRWYRKELQKAALNKLSTQEKEANNNNVTATDNNNVTAANNNNVTATNNNNVTVANKKVKSGANKIEEIAKFAYFYGLEEVSFFCFSVKNFNRERSEVEEIMDYIKKHKLFEYNFPIKIKIYGRADLMEEEVRKSLERYEKETENIKGVQVNLFFGYSSSDEEARRKEHLGSTADENSISNRFFDSKVDLLIRTSGERRLSDFMVKQVANGTAVDFIKPMWPEFSPIHLFLVLLKFRLEEILLKKHQ